MSTVAAEGVAETAVLRHQVGMVHGVVRMNTAGITQQDSLAQPHPGGNCLNWVLGHLMWVYDSMLPLLGQEPVMPAGTLARYARGSAPITDPAEALDVAELLAAWDTAAQRVDAGLAGVTAEKLDQPAPTSPSNNPDETVRTLLTTVLFHQAYHAGQTGVLRRVAGKPGAIA